MAFLSLSSLSSSLSSASEAKITIKSQKMCNADGLPFAFVSFLISIVGFVFWILGLLLTCICPCFCPCIFGLAAIVELALELVKAPLHVMEWFTSQIPC